ncbi:pentapeptide repeat-containing protein [Kribbella italica]|uniref:Uncharacterized protein YjbI with pentapeptide repeats n=1 Tax=Kribbella italica TaxID=1540520 RepID=A0A7W9MXJ5_9ACTN|nr:pentapeptide repeat-containing protein [Kribbella italica]MBB5840211.1 uncharacterized protein YjbI with pentapeptide repeats [Kribbella italica]
MEKGHAKSADIDSPKAAQTPQVDGDKSVLKPRHVIWAAVVVALASVAVGLPLAGWLAVGDGVVWWDPRTFSLPSSQLYDVVRSTIAIIGLVGIGSAALIAYRRQQTTERQLNLAARKQDLEKSAEERADRADYRSRFSAAVDQLGHTEPSIRIAGVYAIAQLADDWGQREPSQRQVCVNVLCATLRLLSLRVNEDDPQELKEQERSEIRNVITQEIARRLTGASGGSWSDCDLPLAGARLTDAKFTGCTFRGDVSFEMAVFDGQRSADFEEAVFNGQVDFTAAAFTSWKTSFKGARFAGGTVRFDHAKFNGSNSVNFRGARFESGEVRFFETAFNSAIIDFREAEFLTETVVMEGSLGGRVSAVGVSAPNMLWDQESWSTPSTHSHVQFSAVVKAGEGRGQSDTRVLLSKAKFTGRVLWDEREAPSAWPGHPAPKQAPDAAQTADPPPDSSPTSV